VASKKWSLLVFLQTLGAIFEVKQRWAPFLLNFQRFCLDIWGFCPFFHGFCPDFQRFCPNFK